MPRCARRVGETLTEDDARAVCECLVVEPRAEDVIVDLRRMRAEEGSAMALLLCALERSRTPDAFVGLHSVHERIRRYLAPELVGRRHASARHRPSAPGRSRGVREGSS